MADLLATSTSTTENHEETMKKALTQAADTLGLSVEECRNIIMDAIAWATSHGILLGFRSPHLPVNTNSVFTHGPIALFPVKFSDKAFQLGKRLSPIYGQLVDKVSRDLDWLHRCLESVVQEDQFTARLVQLSKQVASEGIQQKIYFGIHRSDYMLHEPNEIDEPRLLQVELNTISSGFITLGTRTSALHKFMLDRYAQEHPALQTYYDTTKELVSHLPDNNGLVAVTDSIATAHTHYGVKDAIVLFVVQPNEGNATDQRGLEHRLWDHYKIRVIRRTLSDIYASGEHKDNGDAKRRLFINGKEISVVYFRAGYTPNDYPTENEWTARTLMERSFAIKCPSIAYHLAGTKKIQQELTNPANLRRFIPNEADARALEISFAGLYGLEKDNKATDRVKSMAINNPRGYVLKPQREGGGNNLYNDEMVDALRTMKPNELEQYILMERIVPIEYPSVLVRNGTAIGEKTISELGMYITSLFDAEGNEIVNSHAGHLLRTKFSNVNEGGVNSGFAVLSSPFLT